MRTAVGIGIGVAAFLVASAFARPAGAQVLLSRFDPADRGSRFFVVDSLELTRTDPKDTRPLVSAGVASSFALTTATWGTKREGNRSTLMKHALWLHPGASVTIHPGVRLALDVPVAAYQFGEDTNLAGGYYPAPSSPRIGDIRGSFEMLLLGRGSSDTDTPALSGGVSVWLPTGSAVNYVGDDFTRFGFHLGFRWQLERVLFAARAGYMYRRDAYFGGARVGSEIQANAGVAYVHDQRWTIGPEITMASAIDSELAQRSTPVEVLLGAHADIGPGLRAGAAIGTALVKGMGAADLRAVLSLEWLGPDRNGQRDRDRDGIPDTADMCPDVPGTIDGRGCPNAPMLPDEPPSIPPIDEPPPPPPPPPIAPPPVEPAPQEGSRPE